jgi:hypothetical protein
MHVQRSHPQLALHDCEPSTPQLCEVDGTQPPEQVDHADHVPLRHVCVCWPSPQLHGWDDVPTHVHASHWQLPLHVCEPSAPQLCEVDGVQTPSPVQFDQALQLPVVHVRVCDPQLPHDCVSGPMQLLHVPH